MDLLNAQLKSYSGASPVQKAKRNVLELIQQIETAHEKIVKILESKDTLTGFLDKCITSTTKPKLLQSIGDISIKVDETRGILLEAKMAEEKRKERAERRAERLAIQPAAPAALAAPAVPTIPGMPMFSSMGNMTVTVNIQNGGSISVPDPKPPKITSKPPKAPKLPKAAKAGVYAKKPIPKSVRNQTWNHFIGKEKGEAPCYCCGINRIDKAAFEAGHVIPEVRGGPSIIENLRPICGECNRSMRDMDMREYALKYYGKKV